MMSICARSREVIQKSKLQFPPTLKLPPTLRLWRTSRRAGKIQNDETVKILYFTLLFFILIFTLFIFIVSVALASETNGTITGGGNNGYAWSDQTDWVDLPQSIEPFSPIPGSGIFDGVSGEEAGVSVLPTNITEIEAEEKVGAFERGSLEEAEEEFLPAQLFDINLEIENTKIAGLKDLVARVLLTSFGRVPTPVDLTFNILNESGEKIYSAKDGITVQTQAVLTKRFSDVEEILEIGKYTLLVTTLYNTDVEDEFRQDFEIAGEGAIKKPFWRSLWFWIVSTIALIIIFFVVVKRSKDEEDKYKDGDGNIRITY